MKIPEFIKVGGHTYEIIIDEDLWFNEGHHGTTNYSTQKIRLSTQGHVEVRGTTFLHEILHVIDRVLNLNSLDERTVDILSEGLFQVLSEMGITFER